MASITIRTNFDKCIGTADGHKFECNGTFEAILDTLANLDVPTLDVVELQLGEVYLVKLTTDRDNKSLITIQAVGTNNFSVYITRTFDTIEDSLDYVFEVLAIV